MDFTCPSAREPVQNVWKGEGSLRKTLHVDWMKLVSVTFKVAQTFEKEIRDPPENLMWSTSPVMASVMSNAVCYLKVFHLFPSKKAARVEVFKSLRVTRVKAFYLRKVLYFDHLKTIKTGTFHERSWKEFELCDPAAWKANNHEAIQKSATFQESNKFY